MGGASLKLQEVLASCGGKTHKDNDTDNLDNLLDENTVTVRHNAITDTTLTIGALNMKFTEVSRIFQVDTTGQFYLSVRMIVPVDSSAIATSLYRSLLGYYEDIVVSSDTLPCAPATPTQLANAIDDMGSRFKTFVKPYAADTITHGFLMNADMRPVYGTDSYITYAIYDDYYTGGAHGEIDSYFETFDLATGKAYTFETMFSAKGRAEIRKKLVEIIARDKSMTTDEYLTTLNEFMMPSSPVTEANFPVAHVGITSLGVVFTYPKYSIAPGYEGCPAYVIPLDEVADYLSL